VTQGARTGAEPCACHPSCIFQIFAPFRRTRSGRNRQGSTGASGARYRRGVIWRSILLTGLLLGVACNTTTQTKGATAPGIAPIPLPPAAESAPAPLEIAPELGQLDVPKPDPREARLGAAIRALLEREHVRPHSVDDDISKKAFARFLEGLDPGKLILLKPHVAALERDATKLDDQLRAGDFQLARTGAALVARERKKVAESVAKLLETPFDFTVAESLETDPDKLDFAADEAARVDHWRKFLKQQVLERIERMDETAKAAEKLAKDPKAKQDAKNALPPPPPDFAGREKKAREDLAKTYVGRFTRLAKTQPLEAAENFVNAFASVYDPHTLYLAPEEQENFDIAISGSLEGIGAVLTEDDHYISVRELVPGGAAWREGQLEAGDLILAVKQTGAEPVDVADMRINEVVKMIRGPKGTTVTLTVKKPDERVLIVNIIRDVVVVEEAYARGAMLNLGSKGKQQYGYIHLPSFYGNMRATRGQTPERDATSDVKALLEKFASKKVAGVVLDLRGNGGGLLNHATDITGLFVDKGPVVAARNATGKMQVLGDDHPGVSFSGDVVVLVDRFSASASEILAGALQDYGRALVVGTGPTHGKGTVQAMADLDGLVGPIEGQPLGVVKLTIQQFFLVDGESTQWRGVNPDIVLPDPASHVESGERYLDNAIPWSQVKPLPATPWSHGWNTSSLAEASKKRASAQPAFAKIAARGSYLLERRKDTVVPLELNAWQTQRKKDKEELEKLDPKLDEGPTRFKVEVVEYRPSAKPETAPPSPTRKTSEDEPEKWEDALGRDPWVEEALNLLGDMSLNPGLAKNAPAPAKAK
jgi:carboxyl-terminal processing protease